MNKLTLIATSLMAFLLGACATTSHQYIETTPDGIYTKKVNTSTFNRTVVEEWDSDMAYENCKSDYNRKKLGPAAVEKCRQDTRSDRRKRSNVRNGEAPGGTSSFAGPGFYGQGAFMTPGYGPGGMVGPTFFVPPGRPDYEGTTADPRTSRQSRGSQEDGAAETP